jgi:hypothetical protein
MALSDCPRCWETPCRCGYMRTGLSGLSPYEVDKLKKQNEVMQQELNKLKQQIRDLQKGLLKNVESKMDSWKI